MEECRCSWNGTEGVRGVWHLAPMLNNRLAPDMVLPVLVLECGRTLGLPLLVRCAFFLVVWLRRQIFNVFFFAPFLEEDNSDCLTHGPLISSFCSISSLRALVWG